MRFIYIRKPLFFIIKAGAAFYASSLYDAPSYPAFERPVVDYERGFLGRQVAEGVEHFG